MRKAGNRIAQYRIKNLELYSSAIEYIETRKKAHEIDEKIADGAIRYLQEEFRRKMQRIETKGSSNDLLAPERKGRAGKLGA